MKLPKRGSVKGAAVATALALAALVVAPGSQAGANSASASLGHRDGPLVPPAPASTAPNLPYDASGLADSLQRTTPAAFGGLYYDSSGNLVINVVPTATGVSPASQKVQFDSKSPSPSPHTVFRSVKLSQAYLNGLQAKFTPAVLEGLRKSGALVLGVSVGAELNLLRVSLADDDASNEAAVLAAVGLSSNEVHFEHMDMPSEVATRFNDSSSWNAGDRIFSQNYGEACSSGFGVHDNTGQHYLITAGHCSNALQDFFWNGSAGPCGGPYAPICDPDPLNDRLHAMGFSQSIDEVDHGYDTQLIKTPSNDITWTNVNSRSYITAGYTPVHNDLNAVINEGATSYGWQSGSMVVDQVNALLYDGVAYRDHLWTATQPNHSFCAVKGGDSGGPVVSYNGTFGPLAIGQAEAGNCSTIMFFVIQNMIANSAWLTPVQLNTTTNP